MSGTLSTTGLSISLDDRELEALELDPWQDRAWAAEDLHTFVEKLQSSRDRIERAATQRLLRKHGLGELEPWMAPLLERELSSDDAYRATSRVLEVAVRAELAEARLLFVID